MKKIGIVVTIIVAIAASLVALSTSAHRINYAAARTVNFTEEEVPISKTSLANFEVKSISINVPQANTIFDVRKDPFSNYILQIGYDEASKTYKLYFLKRASSGSKSIIPAKSIILKKREMRLIAGGKILTGKDDIYVGIEDALFTINRKTMSVKSVKLPAVRFKISENPFQTKNSCRITTLLIWQNWITKLQSLKTAQLQFYFTTQEQESSAQ